MAGTNSTAAKTTSGMATSTAGRRPVVGRI
jgi:hypothetical protein